MICGRRKMQNGLFGMNLEGKNVLVTGANGFVGSWLCKKLLDMKVNLFALIKEHIQGSVFNSLDSNSLVKISGDVQDFDYMSSLIKTNEISICFHLAAQTIVGKSNINPLETFRTNVLGTCNMLEASRINDIEVFILASSDKAYGTQKNLPYTEDSPLKGTFPYDASKSCADIIAQSYFYMYELPVSITRSVNIYGGGDMNFSRIFPDTIRSLIKKERPVIRSDGTPVRQYIYVDDVVNGYISIAENFEKVKGEAFNFGSSDPISVLDVVKLITYFYGTKTQPLIKGDDSKGEIHSQYLSSKKARKLLEWEGSVELEDGVKRTIEWYKNHFGV
jgi:CDP-glucose 4,6-dehydratase